MGTFSKGLYWGTEDLVGKRVIGIPSRGFGHHADHPSVSPDKMRVIGTLLREVYFTSSPPVRASMVVETDDGAKVALSDAQLVTAYFSDLPLFYVSSAAGVSKIRFTDLRGYMQTVCTFSKLDAGSSYQSASQTCKWLNGVLKRRPNHVSVALAKLGTDECTIQLCMYAVRQRTAGGLQIGSESPQLLTPPVDVSTDQTKASPRSGLGVLIRNLRTLMRREL